MNRTSQFNNTDQIFSSDNNNVVNISIDPIRDCHIDRHHSQRLLPPIPSFGHVTNINISLITSLSQSTSFRKSNSIPELPFGNVTLRKHGIAQLDVNRHNKLDNSTDKSLSEYPTYVWSPSSMNSNVHVDGKEKSRSILEQTDTSESDDDDNTGTKDKNDRNVYSGFVRTYHEELNNNADESSEHQFNSASQFSIDRDGESRSISMQTDTFESDDDDSDDYDIDDNTGTR